MNFFEKLFPKKEQEIFSAVLTEFQFKETDLLTAKSIIQQLNIGGEIDWISKSDSRFSFPVYKPGLSKRISLNTKTGEVLISTQSEGIFNGMTYLHWIPNLWRFTMDGVAVGLLIFLFNKKKNQKAL